MWIPECLAVVNGDGADGPPVVIHNIPEARYYVYRPAVGWTAQPMVLPTDGWRPPPVGQTDAGAPLAAAVEGLAVYERDAEGRRAHRAPALNFFAVVRDRPVRIAADEHRAPSTAHSALSTA